MPFTVNAVERVAAKRAILLELRECGDGCASASRAGRWCGRMWVARLPAFAWVWRRPMVGM